MLNFSPEFKKKLVADFLIQKIIWFALTGSIIIYCFVIPNMAVEEVKDVTLLLMVLVAVSLLCLAAIYIIHELFSTEKLAKKIFNSNFDKEQFIKSYCTSKYGINQECIERCSKYSELELRMFKLLRFSSVKLIICLVLSETITIFGIIMALSGGGTGFFYSFVTTTLLINIFLFPKLDSLIEISEKVNRSSSN
jgi:hypothetical protein